MELYLHPPQYDFMPSCLIRQDVNFIFLPCLWCWLHWCWIEISGELLWMRQWTLEFPAKSGKFFTRRGAHEGHRRKFYFLFYLWCWLHWCRIEISGGLLWMRQWTLGFPVKSGKFLTRRGAHEGHRFVECIVVGSNTKILGL